MIVGDVCCGKTHLLAIFKDCASLTEYVPTVFEMHITHTKESSAFGNLPTFFGHHISEIIIGTM